MDFADPDTLVKLRHALIALRDVDMDAVPGSMGKSELQQLLNPLRQAISLRERMRHAHVQKLEVESYAQDLIEQAGTQKKEERLIDFYFHSTADIRLEVKRSLPFPE